MMLVNLSSQAPPKKVSSISGPKGADEKLTTLIESFKPSLTPKDGSGHLGVGTLLD